MIYNSFNSEDTIKTAYDFAKSLKNGDIVCLTGDLGAGKTTFTKGIAKALNSVFEPVSPTFNIVNEYPGDIDIYHFDLYRLESEQDLYSVDIDNYLFSDGICIIEWPEIAFSLIDEYYLVHLSYEDNGRKIEIKKVTK